MLNPLDDYPVHQTAEPVAHLATADRHAYDRYFFHGYDREGEVVFGAALGVYPNLGIIDAAVTVVREGRQRSVFASGRLPADRTRTRIGPLAVEVVRPLDVLRVTCDAVDLGLEADLTFRAATIALEEPRHGFRTGTTTTLDATRLTQWGDWSGHLVVDDARIEVRADTHLGLRDRSWGLRPVGDPAPAGAPAHELPAFSWFWAPLRFADGCLHAAANEHADGRRWFSFGARLPLLDDAERADHGADRFDTGGVVEPLRDVDLAVAWRPGTRRAARADLTLVPWRHNPVVVALEPLALLPLRGLGYLHPEWGHGRWHDELAIGSESLALTDLDPTDLAALHVQQVVRATADGPAGTRTGWGVLEQLVVGPHEPSGLTGFTDPAA